MSMKEQFLSSITDYTRSLKNDNYNLIFPDDYIFNSQASTFKLASIGAVEATYSYSYESQGAPLFLLLLTTQGAGTLYVKGNTIALTTNTLLFLNCNTKYRISSASIPWTYQMIYLKPLNIDCYYEEFSRNSTYTYEVKPSSCVPSSFHSILTSQLNDSITQSLSFNKWIMDILAEICIYEHCKDNIVEYTPNYIQDLKELLDTNLRVHYSLNDLEIKCRINKFRLCREFTKYYNVAPLHYHNKKRIEVAKDLLLTTDLTINEVSLTVGFESTNHFINLFKKETGTTPLVFKQGVPASICALHYPYKPNDPER